MTEKHDGSSRARSLTILVSGMIASVPHQGGAAWAVLQYLLGLRQLGHQVYFVEPIPQAALLPQGACLRESANAAYFFDIIREFGLKRHAGLLVTETRETFGLPYAEMREIARRADVLLNLSGVLAEPALTDPIPARVYLDLDPAFTQLWSAVQGIDMHFDAHTHFVTVGLAIGKTECALPTCGIRWIPTAQPIVLQEWTAHHPLRYNALTTVANWRGYGSIEYDGILYGQKVHSWRKFMGLPKRTDEILRPALAIHPDERDDLRALRENGWQILDPLEQANTPARYQSFVRGSKAELAIAKSGYVASRCGWFSDRSIAYLASGRPVLAQETGFSTYFPVGEGLFAFETTDGILAGIDSLKRDYAHHARAARALAETYFDSDQVLSKLLEQIGFDA